MSYRIRQLLSCLAMAGAVLVGACSDDPEPGPRPADLTWHEVVDAPGAALMAVHGLDDDDVWVVGADDGSGPLALHWDGAQWQRIDTGLIGDLWWVWAIDDIVYMAGSDAHIARYANGVVERMPTPGLGKHIVFGLWAAAPDDAWAVGAIAGRNGFIWHYDGAAWTDVPLPDDIPLDNQRDVPAFFKVTGTSADDIWVVGARGIALNGSAERGFHVVDTGTTDALFTVATDGDRVVSVGGVNNAVAFDMVPGSTAIPIAPSPLLQGVAIDARGAVWAAGAEGNIYENTSDGFARVSTGIDREIQSLHAVWASPGGDVWAVGGNVLDNRLDAGVVYVGRADDVAADTLSVPSFQSTVVHTCPTDQIDPHPEGSIARRWNEQLLQAIRRDLPRPTVHARNLFHVSAAMWDVWAARDPSSSGYLVDTAWSGSEADLEVAISYAAYRILTHRYGPAAGGEVSTDCFDEFMRVLGLDPNDVSTDGDGGAAFGNRVAAEYIEHFADDGANEQNDYADPDGWEPSGPRLTVDRPGSGTDDTSAWQQIVLAEAVSQNGIPEGSGVRDYVGAHWGHVEPFAIERPDDDAPYYEPPNIPRDEDVLAASALQVLRYGAQLDVANGTTIDVSPGRYGNNPLATNDGTGHPVNPFTGEAYASNVMLLGDFSRLMAEFWADGPTSETPPGHWNTLANDASDQDEMTFLLFGEGEPLDRLSWDVHMYLALNGALHDAAIAAWELKRTHTSARPITLIRTFGARGQRSDPSGPSYDPRGLALEPGLVEVITAESSRPGERHEHLSRYIGDIAVFSWRGEPGDREHETGGMGWIRAVEWIPYQRRTFVTPAFPGYISGHSTFSRAGAEVLTQLTGSAYFPGGLGGYDIEPGWLVFEYGPAEPVRIQFATWYDAADQAGQSRLWGGIHIIQDDFDGRTVGADVGARAIERASELFASP